MVLAPHFSLILYGGDDSPVAYYESLVNLRSVGGTTVCVKSSDGEHELQSRSRSASRT